MKALTIVLTLFALAAMTAGITFPAFLPAAPAVKSAPAHPLPSAAAPGIAVHRASVTIPTVVQS